MTAPNEALRRYATGGFVMHLTANQVAALVIVAAFQAEFTVRDVRPLRGPRDHFVTSVKALAERGLVVHNQRFDPHYRKHGKHELGGDRPIRTYRLTKAGRLMRDLLREAGVWDELWALLPERPAVAEMAGSGPIDLAG